MVQGKKQGRPLPPEAHRFKKGQSGNPHGRPALTNEQRALRDLTVESYRGVLKTILDGNLEELQTLMKDPKSTVLEVSLASAALKAIKVGDYSVIERIAERIVGKIPDELKINQAGTLQVQGGIDLTLVKKAVAELEGDV